jgi:hypothetical protein
MAKPPLHTPESRALCERKAAEANARGRAEYGPRWAPDMMPCDHPCTACREVAALSERGAAA